MNNRKVRYLLLAVLCIVTFIQIRRQWQHKELQSQVRGTDPANFPAEFNSHGKILGNPQNAISDLQKIYHACLVYREKFKRYPPSGMALLIDMESRLKDYGLTNPNQANLILTNPDVVNSADPMRRDAGNITKYLCYKFSRSRFDGQTVGSPKASGVRDVLAYTDIYYFPNSHVEWEHIDSSSMNPVGFYVVLWDNGQVEKIPFDKALYVPISKNTWQLGFPGQAGLTKGTKTFDEFNLKIPSYRKWKRTQVAQDKAASSVSTGQ